MKSLSLPLLAMLLLGTTPALGGPGHDHSHGPKISAAKAKVVAAKKVEQLIKKGKLDATWKATKPNPPTQKSFGHGPEWVVSFDNPKAKDKKKAKLYIFVSLQGKVLGANFTGK
jgi:hypothetical protein